MNNIPWRNSSIVSREKITHYITFPEDKTSLDELNQQYQTTS